MMSQPAAHGRTDARTCRMLSSDTEAMVQGSSSFQLRSDTLAVWPPWMKSSSGGPSCGGGGRQGRAGQGRDGAGKEWDGRDEYENA